MHPAKKLHKINIKIIYVQLTGSITHTHTDNYLT